MYRVTIYSNVILRRSYDLNYVFVWNEKSNLLISNQIINYEFFIHKRFKRLDFSTSLQFPDIRYGVFFRKESI